MHIRKGDRVCVIAGKEKGRDGEVLRVDLRKNRVYVAGLNIVKRHRRPSAVDPDGGITEKEGPIDASNVLLFSEKEQTGVRTSVRFRGKGGELFQDRKAALESFGGQAGAQVEKVRFCKKTGEVF